ncbi:MAG: complex I subunit 1/NuoH family protein [Solitalea-like symbiont of Tyrophagus putrescentiae]
MIAVICTLLFIIFYTLIITYVERKIAAGMQNRIGPNVVGIKGLLQPFADMLKLAQKTNTVPMSANKYLYFLAPILTFVMIFSSLAVLNPLFSERINVGVYYTLAFLSVKIIGVLISGIASYNKFSLLAAFRACMQLISYEIPLILTIISALMVLGYLDIKNINAAQGILTENKIYLFALLDVSHIGGILSWNILQAPNMLIGFVIFFIASMMASNRGPFDTLEAESEIVAGYHTEYSSIGFALFMLSEYLSMFILALLAVIVFLGGVNTPLPNIGFINLAMLTTGVFWNVFWLILKAIAIVLTQIWLKWTLPRFKPNQVMLVCWKYLVPISLCNLILSMLWVILTR